MFGIKITGVKTQLFTVDGLSKEKEADSKDGKAAVDTKTDSKTEPASKQPVLKAASPATADKVAVVTALVQKILSNVIDHPTEAKYLKLRADKVRCNCAS